MKGRVSGNRKRLAALARYRYLKGQVVAGRRGPYWYARMNALDRFVYHRGELVIAARCELGV